MRQHCGKKNEKKCCFSREDKIRGVWVPNEARVREEVLRDELQVWFGV